MNLPELENLNKVLEEVKILQNRSELLDIILGYWNDETMTFDIPAKYKGKSRLSEEKRKQVPKTPRHAMKSNLIKYLTEEEQRQVGIYDIYTYY